VCLQGVAPPLHRLGAQPAWHPSAAPSAPPPQPATRQQAFHPSYAWDGQKLTFTSILADRPHTVYSGQVVFGGCQGKPAAFIRLTYATIPGGKKGPVCMCTIAPLKEGGTVPKYLEMAATRRLYEGCEISERVFP
jgi:hypothetical protein